MSDAGYDPARANSYEAAKRRLEASTPDVLVVSVELGAHNGLQLAMRCSYSHPTTTVIVMGPASVALEQDARALGAAVYMARPLTTDALIDRLEAVAPIGRLSHGAARSPRHAGVIIGLHATA